MCVCVEVCCDTERSVISLKLWLNISEDWRWCEGVDQRSRAEIQVNICQHLLILVLFLCAVKHQKHSPLLRRQSDHRIHYELKTSLRALVFLSHVNINTQLMSHSFLLNFVRTKTLPSTLVILKQRRAGINIILIKHTEWNREGTCLQTWWNLVYGSQSSQTKSSPKP